MPYESVPFVRDIGHGTVSEIWTHPNRRLDFHVFLYILSGEFQVCEEGVEYILQEGETFFLRKGLHHWGSPKTLPGTSWYYIHFYDTLPKELTYPDENTAMLLGGPAGGELTPEHYQIKIVLPKRMKPAAATHMRAKLKELHELYMRPVICRPIILGLKTAELLLDIYQEAANVREKSKTEVTANKVIAYLERCNPGQKFNGKQLSDHLNMNYAYLSTLFTIQVGMSIQAYHTRLRINKAMELLRQTSSNISEVSEQLGFSSPYHFSHVFKKSTGLSPTQYLKQIYRS